MPYLPLVANIGFCFSLFLIGLEIAWRSSAAMFI